MSIDVAVRSGKHGVRRHRTCAGPSRCSCAAMRGSEVALCGFAQNEFIQCEIRSSPTKSLVPLLQPLQLFETIYPHAAVLLAPTIIRLFRNLDLPNSVNTRLTCPTSTSTSRSFVTVSSGLCHLVAISDPQFPVIKQGPIQWGKIKSRANTITFPAASSDMSQIAQTVYSLKSSSVTFGA